MVENILVLLDNAIISSILNHSPARFRQAQPAQPVFTLPFPQYELR